MLVRLLVSRVGNNFFQEPGEIVDLPVGEARRMIAADLAVAMEDSEPETAMVGGFETATRKPGRPRKAVI